MATKRSIGDLKGKKLFVRVDPNFPLDESLKITDDTRIRAAVPTVKYLMEHGARVILSSHLDNAGPYDKGWIIKVQMRDAGELGS